MIPPEEKEPETPPLDNAAEAAHDAETSRSEEPETAAEPVAPRPVSAAAATSAVEADEAPAGDPLADDIEASAPGPDIGTPPAEDEPEPEASAADDGEPAAAEDDAIADAPKRSRRPRRRKAAEADAERPAVPPKPAPTRRRSRREPGAPAPVVRAQAKYVRSSARKARLVCDHIRGKSVEEARAILALTPRAIASDWSKLLESAVANAEHNHELVGEDLYVKAVHADEGPTIKRFRPRAMGRATPIRKRTSHLTILLTPKD